MQGGLRRALWRPLRLRGRPQVLSRQGKTAPEQLLLPLSPADRAKCRRGGSVPGVSPAAVRGCGQHRPGDEPVRLPVRLLLQDGSFQGQEPSANLLGAEERQLCQVRLTDLYAKSLLKHCFLYSFRAFVNKIEPANSSDAELTSGHGSLIVKRPVTFAISQQREQKRETRRS